MKHRKQILKLIAEQGHVSMGEFTDFAEELTSKLPDIEEQVYELEEVAKQTAYGEEDRTRDVYLTSAAILETVYTPDGDGKAEKHLMDNVMPLETIIAEGDYAKATRYLLRIMEMTRNA